MGGAPPPPNECRLTQVLAAEPRPKALVSHDVFCFTSCVLCCYISASKLVHVGTESPLGPFASLRTGSWHFSPWPPVLRSLVSCSGRNSPRRHQLRSGGGGGRPWVCRLSGLPFEHRGNSPVIRLRSPCQVKKCHPLQLGRDFPGGTGRLKLGWIFGKFTSWFQSGHEVWPA